MYCTLQEAWGESLLENNSTKTSISSAKRPSKKISQQQQFMQKALPPPVHNVRGNTNSAVDIKNYSRDLPGHSETEKRIQMEKHVTIEPYLIDSENTDMYYQLDSVSHDEDMRPVIPVQSEMQVLLMKIDEILKRVDSLSHLVHPQQQQDSLIVICNTLLGIFAGIFIIFLLDMVFRYAKV